MSSIACIGTGAMGSRMAARLRAAGHDLHVWNRTEGRLAGLLGLGARLAATPHDAASRSEVVITMLADEAALMQVAGGPDGLLAGLRPGSLLIEMSTSGPEAVARLAALMPPGTALLDAPVLGSLQEAEQGSLHIFAGGSGDDFDRARPILSALGAPLHVGPLGAGARAKLVANASLIGVLGLLGEVLALADALSLPRDTAYSVLARTPLAAQAERRRPAVESGAYPLRFSLSLALKDARLVTAAARNASVDLGLLPAAAAWLQQAQDAGRGQQDYSAVLAEILGQVRGQER